MLLLSHIILTGWEVPALDNTVPALSVNSNSTYISKWSLIVSIEDHKKNLWTPPGIIVKSNSSDKYESTKAKPFAGITVWTVLSANPVGCNPNCFWPGNSNTESLK